MKLTRTREGYVMELEANEMTIIINSLGTAALTRPHPEAPEADFEAQSLFAQITRDPEYLPPGKFEEWQGD